MGSVEAAYLLDTHTFLWACMEPAKLSRKAAATIKSQQSVLYVSAISAYEILNKYRIGKLYGAESVVFDIPGKIRTLGAIEMPVELRHTVFAGNLEWEHRDPFDRILAAQASLENIPLITNDAALAKLPAIRTLW
ncbi:MAG: type II toxin-antitoxin system VapC family toxin [Clostridiales Family XIII bacterium]|nr:type II toxin-antitoxin system VapC family toxin [Clostridiales Family XIII bacterium]